MSDFYAHPKALVESDAIGEGTRVWAFAHVMPGATIGKNCNICDHAFVEEGAVLGDNVTVKNGVAIWDGVTVGDYCFLGPNAVLTNDKTPRSKAPFTMSRIVLERGVTLGANSTIVCGVTLGEYAMVGAGAVVTKNVPPHTLVLGVPAVAKGVACKCGETIADSDSPVCGECGLRYERLTQGYGIVQ